MKPRVGRRGKAEWHELYTPHSCSLHILSEPPARSLVPGHAPVTAPMMEKCRPPAALCPGISSHGWVALLWMLELGMQRCAPHLPGPTTPSSGDAHSAQDPEIIPGNFPSWSSTKVRNLMFSHQASNPFPPPRLLYHPLDPRSSVWHVSLAQYT